jgi:lipopolysaccharide export system permease protein
MIALLATANRELLIPKIRDKLSRSAQNLGSKRAQPITPTFDPQTGMVFNGGGLNFKEKTILDPQVAMPRGLIATNRPLIAKVAHYEPVTAEHPDGYRLQGMVEPIDLKLVPSYKLQVENPSQANSITDKTILYTPHDSPWLKDDECFVVTEMSFDEIAFPDSWKQFSSTRELVRSINNRGSDVGNGVLTTVHMRLVQPILDSVLMLLGIPLIMRGANRNIFVAIGLSIVVIASFMLVITIGQSLSSNYLINPLLGAWLPLFVFVPVAAYLGEPLWE